MYLRPYMLAQMESMVQKIKHNLKTTQNRKNSYAYRKKTTKECIVGEHVFLRVKLKKSYLRTWAFTKMTPRYVGPFEMLARVGPITYELALPPHIRTHDVFHVSLLKKVYLW